MNQDKEYVKLIDLPNIGPVLEKQLNLVGIRNKKDLTTIGAKQIWLQIQQIDSSACIHKLLALEGAIRNIKKTDLPLSVKEDLREFYLWNKL